MLEKKHLDINAIAIYELAKEFIMYRRNNESMEY